MYFLQDSSTGTNVVLTIIRMRMITKEKPYHDPCSPTLYDTGGQYGTFILHNINES